MIGRVATAVGLIGAGCLAYGVFVERQAFTLRRVTVPVLPAGQRPLTVLHISDVHLSTDRRNLVRWVDSLAGLRPDLVVTTGDNLSQPEALPMVYQAYARLFAFPGVFVFGSNDCVAPNLVNPLRYLGLARERQRHREILPHRELRAAFVERGWYDVEHQRVELAGAVTRQLIADSAGRTTTEVEAVAYLLTQEPATIPDVAEGVGHGYRKARDVLADLRTAGLVLRWQSGSPTRFALTDAGRIVAEEMDAAVWSAITSSHGWPAAVITGKVMELLSASTLKFAPVKAPDRLPPERCQRRGPVHRRRAERDRGWGPERHPAATSMVRTRSAGDEGRGWVCGSRLAGAP